MRYSESFAPDRREAWHVSAFYRDEDQRDELEKALREVQARMRPSRKGSASRQTLKVKAS